MSAHFHSEYVRDAGWRRIVSLALHNVGTVHAGRCNFEEHFTRSRRWPWNFGNAHGTRIALAVDHDRPHALFSYIHTLSLS
jgi:hypothetical protein